MIGWGAQTSWFSSPLLESPHRTLDGWGSCRQHTPRLGVGRGSRPWSLLQVAGLLADTLLVDAVEGAGPGWWVAKEQSRGDIV